MPECKGIWLGDHCSDPSCGKQKRLIGNGSNTPCPRCRQRFTLVKLSERSADMLKALEEAGCAFGAALTAEQHHEAYSHLTAVREVVYKRLEQLERNAGVTELERRCLFRF